MNDRFSENEGKELKEYWYLLIANKYLFLMVFLAIFVGVIVITKLQAPIYQANATILIQQNNYDAQILSFRNLTPRNTIINNHIEMLKSRSLITKVVEELESVNTPDSLYIKDKTISSGRKIGMQR